MGVVQNLVTPKNGEPLVAATQDFLSGSYLLTSRDTFMTRDVFCQCCCHFTNAKMHIDLTPPTILKPIELWTGKQLFNTMLRPNKGSCNVVVNFEVRERDFTEPGDGLLDLMCPNEGYVIFDDSELLCGAVAKMTLGNGSKKGLIYNLIRDNTPFLASAFLGRLASLIGRWFSNYGMTIGIDDVTPNSKVSKAKSVWRNFFF
jgi:DNA-directed RNA polymerase III subunit RPC1